jgi:hypothetical protein
MQGDLSTRNRTQKLKKAQPTQSVGRRIEDREERAAKNKQTSSIGAPQKKKKKLRNSVDREVEIQAL